MTKQSKPPQLRDIDEDKADTRYTKSKQCISAQQKAKRESRKTSAHKRMQKTKNRFRDEKKEETPTQPMKTQPQSRSRSESEPKPKNKSKHRLIQRTYLSHSAAHANNGDSDVDDDDDESKAEQKAAECERPKRETKGAQPTDNVRDAFKMRWTITNAFRCLFLFVSLLFCI